MPPDKQLQIDHLVVGVPDLQQGIDLLERRTGVRPAYGGEHSGSGTHNALLSLGPRQYLELLAFRPEAKPDKESGFLWELIDPERLAGLTEPRLLAWAVSTAEAGHTAERLQAQGYELTGFVAGARKRPDGAQLAWKTFRIAVPGLRSAPFFIEWEEGSAHPAETSPGGCELAALKAFEPEETERALRGLVKVLGVEVDVRRGSPALEAVLEGPGGRLMLKGTK